MKTIKLVLTALAVGSLLTTSGFAQVTNTPISVTGWDENMIVGVGQTYANAGLTATMDNGTNVGAGGNTWYALGQYTASTTTGLPVGVVTTSQNDSTSAFYIQPTGNDALLINQSQVTSGTLTLADPGAYTTLEVFGSDGNGAQVVNYTLNFAGGSTQSGSLNFSDWFGNDGSSTAYNASGRISSAGYNAVGSPNPDIDEVSVPLTFSPGLVLTSVNFSYSSGGANTAIVGISGAVAQLTWTGSNGIGGYSPSSLPNGTTGVWDSTSAASPAPTANWGGASTTYSDAEAVTFNNTGTNTNIAIQSGGVAPYSVTFNNSSVAYTFADADGTNGITGAATVTLSATAGSVTFNSPNSYTGATTINAGTLRINNANSLAGSTTTVNVTSSPTGPSGLVFGAGVGTFNLGGLAGTANLAMTDTGSQPVSLVVGSNGRWLAHQNRQRRAGPFGRQRLRRRHRDHAGHAAVGGRGRAPQRRTFVLAQQQHSFDVGQRRGRNDLERQQRQWHQFHRLRSHLRRGGHERPRRRLLQWHVGQLGFNHQ
jgi:autotransporter-associated beta strand protein